MKKNITYVDAANIEALLTRLGLTTVVQKGFVKVPLGPEGRTLYVGKTARVGRIDISGFTMPEGTEGVFKLAEKMGAVEQGISFEGRTEEQILETLELVATHGATLDPRVKEAKAATAKGGKLPPAKGWSFAPVKTGKELVEKVAEEMGVEVSPNAKAA